MYRILRCKYLQGGHLYDQLPRDPQAPQPGTQQDRDRHKLLVWPKYVAATLQRAANCGLQWLLPEEMSDRQLLECLLPSSIAKPVYKMPDYAYVHKELQRSGVTLNLLWQEYCTKMNEKIWDSV